MALELFNRKGGRSTQPKVSITSAGQIGINATSMRLYFKDISFVLLYADRTKGSIGIKPIDKEVDNAFKLTSSTSRLSGSIAGRSFLKYYDFDFSKSKSFTPKWNEDEEILIIEVG